MVMEKRTFVYPRSPGALSYPLNPLRHTLYRWIGDKQLRVPDKPMAIRMVVIVGTVILMVCAFGIGGFVLSLLFGGAETTPME